jgi:ubiquinone/menaquinone biosynthesis C-methylase UbiE
VFLFHLHRAFWSVYGKFAWDGVEMPIRQRMIRAVVQILGEQAVADGETVLDAGCGTGNYAIALAGKGFCVTGIDFSQVMLACAMTKVTPDLSGHIAFQKMDMNSRLLFADASFDHLISMTSLWVVADPKFTLNEFSRVLKPGGTLVVMQVPRPSANVRQTIARRLAHLKKKSPLAMLLVAFKVIIERTSANKYWTTEELLALMMGNKQLKVSSVDPGPPIFIVATKIVVT